MHMIVTGATGFIGRAVVQAALKRGHHVTAVVRDENKAKAVLSVSSKNLDVSVAARLEDIDPAALKRGDDRLIHLAWAEVGKYTDPGNLLDNLAPQFLFLKKALAGGIRHLTVAGSCLEYGLQEGALKEGAAVAPVTYYGLAKHTLHRMLMVDSDKNMQLNWLRYFYVYGEGQRPQAILPQLMAAIARGDKTFNMSPGDQSRDFVHVTTAAHNTVVIAEQPQGMGVVNVGGGRPMRVLDLVKEALQQKNAAMDLNPGFYPYASYEPFSFWADVAQLKTIPEVILDQKIIL